MSSIVSVALFAVGVVERHDYRLPPRDGRGPSLAHASQGSACRLAHLLERIGFIWHRMGFLNKVAARKPVPLQKRALMTIFGIAGCTALVIALWASAIRR